MSRTRVFLPSLRELERQLSIPLPQRIRVLRELEFDLEALRERLESEGVSPETARTRSLDTLVPDTTAIRELVRLYEPRYRRATREISENRLRRLERFAFAVVTTAVFFAASLVILGSNLFADRSPFLWVVLGLGSLTVGMVLNASFELWVRGERAGAQWMLRAILAMVGAIVLAGTSGALMDTLQLLRTLELEAVLVQPHSGSWLVRETTLLAVSLAFALAGSLAWFVLRQWQTLEWGAYQDVLGLNAQAIPKTET